jgi:hypothetical protein
MRTGSATSQLCEIKAASVLEHNQLAVKDKSLGREGREMPR